MGLKDQVDSDISAVFLNNGEFAETYAIKMGDKTAEVVGVFEFPKATGALTTGASVYWDPAASNITSTATNNIPAGMVVDDAASAATTVKVRIG